MKTNRLVALGALLLAAVPLPSAAAETPSCAPEGTALSIAAMDKQFDKDCLAAPAGQAFTIDFDNQDIAARHNVAIYDTAHGGKELFKGEIVIGPRKVTYSVPAQAAGTYEFRCDPHAKTMIGTFVVQ